jgi:hypothetical protein
MDLQGFFSAIFTDWVALMSGITSVVLTILGVVRKWDTLPRRVLWIAALICFFFAAARVWTAEHRVRLAAEKHLEELTIPKFRGAISFVAAAPGEKGSIVTLAVVIYNDGAPSFAENFRVVMKSDKQEKELLPVAPPLPFGTFILHRERPQSDLVFQGTDYLPRASMSISHKVFGFLSVFAKDVPI